MSTAFWLKEHKGSFLETSFSFDNLNGLQESHQAALNDADYVVGNRSSITTPGFRAIRRGRKKSRVIDLPMNPFGFSQNKNSGAIGTMYNRVLNKSNGSYNGSLSSGYWGRNIPGISPSSEVFARLEAKSLNKLLGKLHDQSVSLGIAVGEGKQTIKLFVQTARKLADAAVQLRRGDVAGAAGILLGTTHVQARKHTSVSEFKKDLRRNGPKALAKGWLELQYGWKPAITDLFGACEYLANKLHRYPRFKETSSSFVGFTRTDLGDSDPNLRYTDIYTETYTVKYICYYSQDEGQHDLSALGLINPVAIAWELVPWSFVVDWALPIGTWLGNLDSTFGLNFVKGCKTTFWKGSVTRQRQGKSYTVGDIETLNIGQINERLEKIECARAPLGGFPSAPLPSWKNPFSQYNSILDPGDHALNALALLTQAFKGGSTSRGF